MEQELAHPLPYVKFSEMEFFTEEQKIACRELYKSIENMNLSIAEDEEKLYIMMDEIGKEATFAIMGQYMLNRYDMHKAMLKTFWYLTSINFASVILDFTDDEKKELYPFDLL
jgi:hypothetical protein